MFPRLAQGLHAVVVLGLAVVVVTDEGVVVAALVVVVPVLVPELEEPVPVTLGGKGVTTTSDGRGPLVSPPASLLAPLVVVELLVDEAGGWEGRLLAGMCLPLIHICAVEDACLALALACSSSLAFFLSLFFSSFFSFSLAALSSSSLAFIILFV